MKKLLIAGAVMLATAGCQMSAPQTAQDARMQARGNSFSNMQATLPVSRSVSAVNASIRQGAARCFNRTVSQRSVSANGQMVSYPTTFTSQFRSSARVGELTVNRRIPDGVVQVGPKDGVIMVVDTQATNAGTNVTILGSRFGTRKMTEAIVLWAKGGPIRCPEAV